MDAICIIIGSIPYITAACFIYGVVCAWREVVCH